MNTFSNGQIGANGDMDQGWVSWTGVGLVALGSTLLWASKAADARSSIITGLSCIEDLVDLEKMRHLMPLLLAVRAKVGSKSPIYNRESKACVISTVVEEEIWRKEKENGRLSHEPFQTAVNRSVSPSWHLETDKGSSPVVVVEGAEHAEGLLGVMAVSQTFKAEDDSKQSLARLILDKAWRM